MHIIPKTLGTQAEILTHLQFSCKWPLPEHKENLHCKEKPDGGSILRHIKTLKHYFYIGKPDFKFSCFIVRVKLSFSIRK